ncbi:hypothetical protein [Neptunomonas phycophila]|uniref:hypothetical protein n=1 Tax=Neptunomonas phycophila TaxID=1572645 RepID=UPI0015BB4312|nr:hypothetical protein [Neptunomonas phycophila]QLE98925.1 hypothetical protein FLM49_15520 [Neptunomonas phycophila]
MFRFTIALFIFICALSSYAAGGGVIKEIVFSGAKDGSHPNVVQIKIVGGFEQADCNRHFSAIRVSDENQHLISFVMAAFMSKEPVKVVLASNDKYYQDRCTIVRISNVY